MTSKAMRVLAAAAAAMTVCGGTAAANASSADTQRVSGANRYLTSVAVSKHVSALDPTMDDSPVFIASGQAFPDGLAAAAQAGSYGGRVLLVPSTGTLPTSVADELRRLGTVGAIIMGGTGAISAGMERQIDAVVAQSIRLDGANRYETAAQTASIAPADVMFVASGLDFPDALAGGAAAGSMQGSVVLTTPTGLPAASRDVLTTTQPSTVVVLGGPGAVSDGVMTQIRQAVPAATVTRVSGTTRWSTAAAISKYAFPNGSPVVYLASGRDYADALPASAAAGGRPAPLLLSDANCVPKATLNEISRLRATKFVAVGGTGVLSTNVINRVPCSY